PPPLREPGMDGCPCRTIPCSTAPLVSPRRASDSRRVATDIAGTIRVTLEEGWSVEAAGAAFGTTGLQPTVSFQHGVEHDRGHQHKEQRGRVTEDPVELWP